MIMSEVAGLKPILFWNFPRRAGGRRCSHNTFKLPIYVHLTIPHFPQISFLPLCDYLVCVFYSAGQQCSELSCSGDVKIAFSHHALPPHGFTFRPTSKACLSTEFLFSFNQSYFIQTNVWKFLGLSRLASVRKWFLFQCYSDLQHHGPSKYLLQAPLRQYLTWMLLHSEFPRLLYHLLVLNFPIAALNV